MNLIQIAAAILGCALLLAIVLMNEKAFSTRIYTLPKRTQKLLLGGFLIVEITEFVLCYLAGWFK